MGIIITGISLAFPKKNLTHEELQKRFGVDVMDRLLNNTQITNRKVCSKDQCASDLGFEAAKAVLTYGFSKLGLKKVVGLTAEENFGSIKILEKLGFKLQEKFLFNNTKALKYQYTKD